MQDIVHLGIAKRKLRTGDGVRFGRRPDFSSFSGGGKAADTNPEFNGNWLWRAAAYAQAGERERARELTDRILERQPDTTISGNFIQIQHPDLMEKLREGWRKAGIPD